MDGKQEAHYTGRLRSRLVFTSDIFWGYLRNFRSVAGFHTMYPNAPFLLGFCVGVKLARWNRVCLDISWALAYTESVAESAQTRERCG